MVSVITIIYTVFIGVLIIVGGIIGYKLWKAKHPYKVRVRRLTSTNTKVIRDAIGKKKKDKKGIEYIKVYYGLFKKPLPNKMPIPSADVIEYDSSANKMIIEAWYDDTRGFIYVKDTTNSDSLNALGGQEGFRTFPTNSREMLINQYNIANSMRQKSTPEMVMYLTPFIALIMILTVFLIFFGKVVQPIENSAQSARAFQLEWMEKASSIQESQARLMEGISNYEGGSFDNGGQVIVAPDAEA